MSEKNEPGQENRLIAQNDNWFENRTLPHTTEEWAKENFNLAKELSHLPGPFIEVAGPTLSGYRQLDTEAFKDRLFVSNLHPGVPRFDRKEPYFKGKVDFQASASRLPLADNSIDALLASGLSTTNLEEKGSNTSKRWTMTKELRGNAIIEATRVLRDKGLLIWEGGSVDDLADAKAMGLELQQYILSKYSNGVENYDFVCRK